MPSTDARPELPPVQTQNVLTPATSMGIPPYWHPAPEPGTTGAPFFTGRDVSKFVTQWEGFCRKYLMTAEEFFVRLTDYSEESIGVLIEASKFPLLIQPGQLLPQQKRIPPRAIAFCVPKVTCVAWSPYLDSGFEGLWCEFLGPFMFSSEERICSWSNQVGSVASFDQIILSYQHEDNRFSPARREIQTGFPEAFSLSWGEVT